MNNQTKDDIFNTIYNAIQAKDEATAIHSKNVAILSKQIGEKLGLGKKKIEDIYYMALVHDIGKIGMPDSILKGSKRVVSQEEMRQIQEHVSTGAGIVKDFPLVKNLFIGPKYHQEFYDGTGYKEGLAGDKIPIEARIIAIADAIDAMGTDRLYKNALSKEAIVSELSAKSGSQFDPNITKIAIEMLNKKVDK